MWRFFAGIGVWAVAAAVPTVVFIVVNPGASVPSTIILAVSLYAFGYLGRGMADTMYRTWVHNNLMNKLIVTMDEIYNRRNIRQL